jgi:electron transfer flavoprotein alpha subunit
MPNPILVFCEQRDGQLKRVGREALGEAHRLGRSSGRDVCACIIGSGVSSLASDLSAYGASQVFVAEDGLLAHYSAELYTTILAGLVARLQPVAIFIGATAMGKDLAPRLAARLKTALVQDCVALVMEVDGSLVATRPIYGGKLRAVVKPVSPALQVVTLRPNVFSALEPQPNTDISIEHLAIPTNETRPVAKVREVQPTAGGSHELTETPIIVSGGRGLKAAENFTCVEELAEALDAAVGASRAVVDAGWKPHSYQVGLTGKTVSPQLYIACGISGAIQHLAGMSSARVIVAINSNPDAPIFKLATYGIVGDLFEILPLLTEEVKKLRT